MKSFLLSLVLIFCSFQVLADSWNNSNKLFDWAEKNYPEYFSPLGQTTFEIKGYLARYYSDINAYIGVLDENVYVYGDIFGGGLQQVGKISDFITPDIISINANTNTNANANANAIAIYQDCINKVTNDILIVGDVASFGYEICKGYLTVFLADGELCKTYKDLGILETVQQYNQVCLETK